MTGQSHENDIAAMVVVCKPAISKAMGALHPAGALYERPVNMSRAIEAHQNFVNLLRSRGVVVRDVSEILCDRVDKFVGDRVELEKLAATRLTYEFRSSLDSCDSCDSGPDVPLQKDEEFWITDEYKQLVIQEMTSQQLVDTLFTNPTVTVSPSQRDTGLTASYRFEPLSNIIFVRDQQITTRKGIVMARLRSQQRRKEAEILEFCFRKIGLNVIGKIPAPCHLEGGDFFPAGDELVFIGLGPRSTWSAIEYLLQEDLVGTHRVAVVRDELERRQERMHLDTVFNIISDNCCLMLEDMMGEESSTKRMVDEYVVDDAEATPPPGYLNGTSRLRVGKYRLNRTDVEFSAYVRDQGYSIIEVSGKEQLNYGCNILNLGDGNIISTEKNTARRIAASPHFKGTVEYLNFEGVSCMYGGVHCASQVVKRRPRV